MRLSENEKHDILLVITALLFILLASGLIAGPGEETGTVIPLA
jgi:hypothetical protein